MPPKRGTFSTAASDESMERAYRSQSEGAVVAIPDTEAVARSVSAPLERVLQQDELNLAMAESRASFVEEKHDEDYYAALEASKLQVNEDEDYNTAIAASLRDEDDADLVEMKRAAYEGGSNVQELYSQDTVAIPAQAAALNEDAEYDAAIAASLQQEDDDLVALKRAAYGNFASAESMQQQQQQQHDSVAIPAEAAALDEPWQEATILAEPWVAGEAQVLEDELLEDSKPAAIDYSQVTEANEATIVQQVDEEEALVVGVEEQLHPNEFTEDSQTAELVGQRAESVGAVAVVEESVEPNAIETDDMNSDIPTTSLVGAHSQVIEDESVVGATSSMEEAVVVSVQDVMHPAEIEDAVPTELLGADMSSLRVSSVTVNTLSDLVGTDEAIATLEPLGAPAIGEAVAVEDQAEILDIREDVHPAEDLAGVSAELVALESEHHEECVTLHSTPRNDVVGEALVLEISESNVYPEPPSIEKGAVIAPSRPDSIAVDAATLPVSTIPDEDSRYPQKPAPTTPLQAPTDGEIDWMADTPPPGRPFGHSDESGTSGAQSVNSQRLTSSITRGIEAIFGDTLPPFMSRRDRSGSNIASYVVPRQLLPWSVIFSPATKMWVATLQTNQRALDKNDVAEASKSLRAFSLPTERAAIALAKAWTPPRMLPKKNTCHICNSRFALLRRSCHCRNCGIVICKECAVIWPSKMIPDTYNIKKENNVNVCGACDWLCTSFRLALLEGNQDKAVAIFATGNINLNAPFGNVKGELFYPVHCAVLGGDLRLLRWLVDDNCCPIKSLRVSGGGRDSSGTYTPIVTSRGRSLLGIAMEHMKIDILRYLVIQKGISIAGEQDITFEMLQRNLDQVLRFLPEESYDHRTTAQEAGLTDSFTSPLAPRGLDAAMSPQDHFHMEQIAMLNGGTTEDQDDCIICFDGKIDCVATPCGHQVCCLRCSAQITKCPVCSSDCSFMRVFKP